MSDKVSLALYRSLLRTIKPFTSQKTGPILTSLLYRSGADDYVDYIQESKAAALGSESASTSGSSESDDSYKHLPREQARDLSHSYAELLKKREMSRQEELRWLNYHSETSASVLSDIPPQIILYKSCLKEIIPGHMNFPTRTKTRHQANQSNVMDRLRDVIRREFRNNDDSLSKQLDGITDKHRREVAFMAIKELQKKLAWAESMSQTISSSSADSKAKDVGDDESSSLIGIRHDLFIAKDIERLPEKPASSYLRTGAFLIAHPLLTGCFAKSVICLMEHTKSDSGDEANSGKAPEPMGGTYGIIINKPLKIDSSNQRNGLATENETEIRDRTLGEVIRHDCLPSGVTTAFGNSPVRNGGPVHVSIQMLRRTTPDDDEKLKIGGSVLSRVLNDNEESVDSGSDIKVEERVESNNEVQTTAMNTDAAIIFAGDIIKASQAVIDEDMNEKSFSFIIGASCWEDGQLESEIEKGYWIPFSGPPELAFSGACEVRGMDEVLASENSLWVSIMAALGEEEGRFANLVDKFEFGDNGMPCDDI